MKHLVRERKERKEEKKKIDNKNARKNKILEIKRRGFGGSMPLLYKLYLLLNIHSHTDNHLVTFAEMLWFVLITVL